MDAPADLTRENQHSCGTHMPPQRPFVLSRSDQSSISGVFPGFLRILAHFGDTFIPKLNDLVQSNRYQPAPLCGTIEHANARLVEDCT
jgi:hypothetical protein